MLTHKAVWHGIDQLAARNQLSASGLAKRAGLDPTTFNKSKRTTKQGKARWPSTESLSKVLEATQTTMTEFIALLDEGPVGRGSAPARRLRCLALHEAEGDARALDAAGFPQAAPGWEDVELGALADPAAYVIELDRDIAPPLLRSGDLVVIAPHSAVRRQDRVIVRRRGGGLEFAIFVRKTAQRIALGALTGGENRSVDMADIAWLARIVAICPNQ